MGENYLNRNHDWQGLFKVAESFVNESRELGEPSILLTCQALNNTVCWMSCWVSEGAS